MSNPDTSAKVLGVVVLMLLGIGWGNITAPVNGEEGMGLFIDVVDSPIDVADSAIAEYREAAINPTILRSRLVDIDWDILAVADDPSESKTISSDVLLLNLFEDTFFTTVLDHWEARSGNNFIWIGHIEGVEESQVTIVVQDNVMVGNIRVSGESYQVRYMGEGVHVIHEIDERYFPPEGEPIPVDNSSQDFDAFLSPEEFQAETAADDGSTLDVMVVYTPAARVAAGGTTAMNALINLAISETNTAYSNSGVIPRVRLVHTEEVNYTESGDSSTDLNRLKDTADGFIDNVHALRDIHGADMVSLFAEDFVLNPVCGRAKLMISLSPTFESSAFSVVRRICATGNYTFGHELGHNMGLTHDRASQPLDGVFSYSYGYVDIPNDFRTIMGVSTTCPTCTRIQHFSNPAVNFGGNPTGVDFQAANSADAARSLNNAAFTVANWRESPNRDLVIEGLRASPSSVAPGGSTTVSYDIANRGTTTVTESYTEKIYLSTNNTLGGTDVLLGTSHLHTIDLAPGGIHSDSSTSKTVTISTGTIPGSYFILVESDALATVTESDESNNVTAVELTVTVPLLAVTKEGNGSGTVTSSPAGINCGATCQASFSISTSVTLSATPSADSVFAGFSGDSDCSDGVVTMNGNKTCTATFNKIPRTLTVTKAGVGSGTVTSNPSGITCGSTCSVSFDSGTSVTLTAASDPDSTFAGFSGGSCSGTGPCTIIVNADTTVIATFSLTPFTFTDDPLILQITPMKVVHITELRQAINTLRSRNGLSAFTFTDPTLIAGISPIRAVHITQLRTALNAVFDALAQTRPVYTDPMIVPGQTVVKKVHIEEIRSAVRTVESIPTQ